MDMIKFIQLDDNQDYENPLNMFFFQHENSWLMGYYIIFIVFIISYSYIYSKYLCYPSIRKDITARLCCKYDSSRTISESNNIRNSRLLRIRSLLLSLKDLEASSPTISSSNPSSPLKQIYTDILTKNRTNATNSNLIEKGSVKSIVIKNCKIIEEHKEEELKVTLLSNNQIRLN